MPVIGSLVVSMIAPASGEVVGRTDQLWFGSLGLAGVVVGALWQWFSPRPLAERFLLAAAVFPLGCIFILLPLGGEWVARQHILFSGLGMAAGLVLTTWWQRVRAARSTE